MGKLILAVFGLLGYWVAVSAGFLDESDEWQPKASVAYRPDISAKVHSGYFDFTVTAYMLKDHNGQDIITAKVYSKKLRQAFKINATCTSGSRVGHGEAVVLYVVASGSGYVEVLDLNNSICSGDSENGYN